MNAACRKQGLNEAFKRFQRLPDWPKNRISEIPAIECKKVVNGTGARQSLSGTDQELPLAVPSLPTSIDVVDKLLRDREALRLFCDRRPVTTNSE